MNTLPLRQKFFNVNILLKVSSRSTSGQKLGIQNWPTLCSTTSSRKLCSHQWVYRQLCLGTYLSHPYNESLLLDRKYYSNLAPKPKPSQTPDDSSTSVPPASSKDQSEVPVSKRSMPRLMDFPEIMWPSFFNSVRNWVLVQFVIRPHFDRDFYLNDFVEGAKKAIQVISAKLMNSEFNALQNLVSAEAIEQLKPVVQNLSMTQRRELLIRDSDIYVSFPYEVGIMFDNDNSNDSDKPAPTTWSERKVQKRWVEITMVFHVLQGLREMRESGEEIPWSIGTMPEYQNRLHVCNYRFIKEFTRGQESDWIVNKINHFKPIDLVNEQK